MHLHIAEEGNDQIQDLRVPLTSKGCEGVGWKRQHEFMKETHAELEVHGTKTLASS